jgi:hypothetical protein
MELSARSWGPLSLRTERISRRTWGLSRSVGGRSHL